MASIAKTRMRREIQAIKTNKDESLQIELVGDSMEHLKGTIYGPEGTPYHTQSSKLYIYGQIFPCRSVSGSRMLVLRTL